MALRIVRSACTLALAALILAEIRHRGPLRRPPVTVTSNSRPGQASLDPYLIFLREAGRRIPRGTTVAVVPVAPGEMATGSSYLLALSQMPEQTILPITRLRAEVEPPEWVLSFGADFSDPRFRIAAVFGAGKLFKAAR